MIIHPLNHPIKKGEPHGRPTIPARSLMRCHRLWRNGGIISITFCRCLPLVLLLVLAEGHRSILHIRRAVLFRTSFSPFPTHLSRNGGGLSRTPRMPRFRRPLLPRWRRPSVPLLMGELCSGSPRPRRRLPVHSRHQENC